MTFNSKGFQPLMALNSALARCIKGFSPLPFIVIRCHCTLPNFPKLSVLRQPANAAIKPRAESSTLELCRGGAVKGHRR